MRGDDHPRSILTEAEVRWIKDRVRQAPRTKGGFLPRGLRREMADRLGVPDATIQNVLYGNAWRWIE